MYSSLSLVCHTGLRGSLGAMWLLKISDHAGSYYLHPFLAIRSANGPVFTAKGVGAKKNWGSNEMSLSSCPLAGFVIPRLSLAERTVDSPVRVGAKFRCETVGLRILESDHINDVQTKTYSKR